MDKLIKLVIAAGALSISQQSIASFHTWDINEIFSNADGTIQFIELREMNGSNNQHLFGSTGRGLEMDDGTPATFFFGANLPSTATANKYALIATSGFAALAGFAPDYVMPDNFLTISGGTVGFGTTTNSFTTDTLTFASLPTDGVTSFFKGGTTGINSPTNFAGNTGSLTTVPIPTPAVLLGSGVMALLGISRKKHR